MKSGILPINCVTKNKIGVRVHKKLQGRHTAMSLSKATSKFPEVTLAVEQGLAEVDRYCKKHEVSKSNTLTAKRLYRRVHNIETEKTLGIQAMVAACVFTASDFQKVFQLGTLCDELGAPIHNTLQALWLVCHYYELNQVEKVSRLVIIFESSSWDNPNAYSIVDEAGVKKPKLITLSRPGCLEWTLSGDFDSACHCLCTLRQRWQDLMLKKTNKTGLPSRKKPITLVEEVPATRRVRPERSAQLDQELCAKAPELTESPFIDSASAGTTTILKTGKETSKSVQTKKTESVDKANEVESLANGAGEEAEWDIINATNYDEIEMKWVNINGRTLGTAKNGRRRWTSGLKDFFG